MADGVTFAGDIGKDSMISVPSDTGAPNGSLSEGGPVEYAKGSDQGMSTGETGSGKSGGSTDGPVQFAGDI